MTDWVHVSLDLPASHPAVDFWAAALGWPLGTPWPNHPEFRSFVPAAGDRYVHHQAVDGAPGVHLDIEVDDVAGEAERVLDLGARHVATEADWRTFHSPGGLPFCLVGASEHGSRPAPCGGPGARRRLVQVCIDVPEPVADGEFVFWQTVTGWRAAPADSRPFVGKLFPAPGSPIQVLVQALTVDDDFAGIRAHLDLGVDDLEGAADLMTSLGAERLWADDGWITLRDPAGQLFCVTQNSPDAP